MQPTENATRGDALPHTNKADVLRPAHRHTADRKG